MKLAQNTFNSFQKLGKSLMLPIAVLPIAALLLRFGVLLNLDFVTAAGNAVFENLALIFGIGVAIGLAFDGNGAAGLAGAVAHFIIVKGSQAINPDINMGVLSGIIGGIIAAACYNKFYNISLPSWLGFFAGRRFVPVITGLVCILVAFLFGSFWIYVQNVLSGTTSGLASLGALGLFIYGTLNRLLIPLGLHHVLNTYFWFQFGEYEGADGVVNGDLTRFFAGDATAGQYMTGFFPIMMFALPAAAYAMYVMAKKERKQAAAGILFSVAFTSFLTGITEPLEFAFMFLAPVLYGIHALLTGLSLAITYALGIKLGFGFSAGLIDYILNWELATKPALMLPIGLAFAALYFVIFVFGIRTFNLKTIGREDDATEAVKIAPGAEAVAFAQALGGLANITSVTSCVTRLRTVVVDGAKVDKDRIKALGSQGIITPSKNAVQIVLGQKAEPLADAINALKQQNGLQNTGQNTGDKTQEVLICSPFRGRVVLLDNVPDDAFAQRMVGDGVAVLPSSDIVKNAIADNPLDIFKTNHAIAYEIGELELIVHIGIDTVSLKGEGFTPLVESEKAYALETDVLQVDRAFVEKQGLSLVSPIVSPNMDVVASMDVLVEEGQEVDYGAPLLKFVLK